jgi:hypothetical protein
LFVRGIIADAIRSYSLFIGFVGALLKRDEGLHRRSIADAIRSCSSFLG